MAYIKPYSPGGAAVGAIGDLLMKFLMQMQLQKKDDTNRAQDRAERAKEFAANQGLEQQRIGLEQSRLTQDQKYRDEQQRTQNAGIMADSLSPGPLDPKLAAAVQKALEGTPYAARLQSTGEEGTLPSTQMSPDAVGGMRKVQDPGGINTSVIPTFQQRQLQDETEMRKKAFDTEQTNQSLMQRMLAGQKTDSEKEADRIHEMAVQHGYNMEELNARLKEATKKTSIDDDLKTYAALKTSADKETDDTESAKLRGVADMYLEVIQQKYPGFKIKADQPVAPPAGPKRAVVPGDQSGGINYPAAIKDFLLGGSFTPTRGGGPF